VTPSRASSPSTSHFEAKSRDSESLLLLSLRQ